MSRNRKTLHPHLRLCWWPGRSPGSAAVVLGRRWHPGAMERVLSSFVSLGLGQGLYNMCATRAPSEQPMLIRAPMRLVQSRSARSDPSCQRRGVSGLEHVVISTWTSTSPGFYVASPCRRLCGCNARHRHARKGQVCREHGLTHRRRLLAWC